MERWWRETKGDHRDFEDVSWAEVYEFFYSETWKRLNDYKNRIKHATSGQERAHLAHAIDEMQEIFSETHTRELVTDKLVETWEDMLDRGEMPDFTSDMSPEVKRRLGITE